MIVTCPLTFTRFTRLSAMLVLAFAAGCGGPSTDNVLHLSGNATYRGQPIPFGTLVFNPDQAAGHKGLQGYATIENGQYDTRGGTGVTSGSYQVTVIAYKEKPDLSGDETNPKAGVVSPLFPDYTLKLELKSESQDIEVPDTWPTKRGGKS